MSPDTRHSRRFRKTNRTTICSRRARKNPPTSQDSLCTSTTTVKLDVLAVGANRPCPSPLRTSSVMPTTTRRVTRAGYAIGITGSRLAARRVGHLLSGSYNTNLFISIYRGPWKFVSEGYHQTVWGMSRHVPHGYYSYPSFAG